MKQSLKHLADPRDQLEFNFLQLAETAPLVAIYFEGLKEAMAIETEQLRLAISRTRCRYGDGCTSSPCPCCDQSSSYELLHQLSGEPQ